MNQTPGSFSVWPIASACVLLALLMTGCAPQKVNSVWMQDRVVVNGSEEEWTQGPQFYDRDRSLTIRTGNRHDSIYLCFATSDDTLVEQLKRSGLTLWIDPSGGEQKTFGIYLPAADRAMHGRRKGVKRHADEETKTRQKNSQRALTPESLAIRYSNTTGPLEMTLNEVRGTGIDIGVKAHPGRGLVYEFAIRFDAAHSLGALAPGAVVGLGFETTATVQDETERRPPNTQNGRSGGGRGGRGGGGFGGRGGGGSSRNERGEAFEVWLIVTLSENVAGE